MQFIRPEFLYFLAAIAIPVIIHLFNFRKFKRIYFTNVRFLNEVKRQTQSKSKLRHLIVLATRILAIACLVFAFAQPFIPAPDRDVAAGRKAVSIYIDNSFSMDALDKSGSLFETAKRKAREVVESYGVNDDFQLLTNDFEGKHQRLVKGEEFVQMLDEIEISPVNRTLSEVFTRQQDVLQNTDASGKRAIILSDFQRSMVDAKEIKTDTNISTLLVPLEAKIKVNLYVDSVWFRTPIRQLNQQEEISIRIYNASNESMENVPLKLFLNGEAKAIGSFNVKPYSAVDTTLFFTNSRGGIQHGRVSIQDYPITYDDDFYFSYEIQEQQQILMLHGGKDADTLSKALGYVRSVFANDEFFNLRLASVNSLDYSTLSRYSLLLLNGLNTISSGIATELEKFVTKGGSLVVFPGAEIDTKSYREFLLLMGAEPYLALDTASRKVRFLNTAHEIYTGVFEKIPENMELPVVQKCYPITKVLSSGRESLLGMEGSEPFLSAYKHGRGKLYTCASSLAPSFSNFHRHAIFVTTLLRMAEFSAPNGSPFYTIGVDERVEVSDATVTGDAVFHLASADPGQNFEIIPEHTNINGTTNILVHNQIQNAGNYILSFNKAVVRGLAFNYARTESDIETIDAEGLTDLLKEFSLYQVNVVDTAAENIQQSIAELSEGKKLWKLFIILALGFLGIEVLLLKFWK